MTCVVGHGNGVGGCAPHYRFQNVFGATAAATDLPEFLKSVDCNIATLSDQPDLVNRENNSLENALLVEHQSIGASSIYSESTNNPSLYKDTPDFLNTDALIMAHPYC